MGTEASTASGGRANDGLLALRMGCKNRLPVEHGTQWRFATGEFVGDRRSLIAAVLGYEAMGYDVIGASDHLRNARPAVGIGDRRRGTEGLGW